MKKHEFLRQYIIQYLATHAVHNGCLRIPVEKATSSAEAAWRACQDKILVTGTSFLPDLVIVEPKNEQPASNEVYIDHIYERLVQKATPEELISLAERLDRTGKVSGDL